MTMYLVAKRHKTRAHVWLASDTACRMWSTGGLKESNYEISDDPGEHKVCQMCKQLSARREA